ncbi:MAG: glycosyltransferase family 4 protein [Campylobacteraceae bacterium]|nr:glycosyltransferase family 4 protein [Campylobacteraceae bacterium]
MKNKILILLVENYSAGGSDKVARILYENLSLKKIHLFINKSNDTSILLSSKFKDNFQITYYNLITIAELGKYANSKKKFFFLYILLKIFNLIVRYPLFFISIIYFYYKFKKINGDLFISNNGGYPGGEYCRSSTIAARLVNLKCFHIIHSIPTSVFFKPFKHIESLIDNLVDKSSKILCVSNDIKSKLQITRNIKQNTKVIHNGIKKEQLKNYVNTDTLRLLNVASLYSLKNQIFLIKVIKKIIDSGYLNIELHLVGKEEEEGYLDKLKLLAKEYRIEEKIFFHGFTCPYKYYHECDIFVLSSKTEGFPMVTLESMSIGMPVISVDVGGVREQIIDNYNGFLLNNYNINDFAQKVLFFYSKRENIEILGKNAYKYFLENFTIDKMIENYNKELGE